MSMYRKQTIHFITFTHFHHLCENRDTFHQSPAHNLIIIFFYQLQGSAGSKSSRKVEVSDWGRGEVCDLMQVWGCNTTRRLTQNSSLNWGSYYRCVFQSQFHPEVWRSSSCVVPGGPLSGRSRHTWNRRVWPCWVSACVFVFCVLLCQK